MKRLSWALPVGLICWLCVTGVVADDVIEQERLESMFRELDTNGNGVITADELSENQVRAFYRLLRIADENEDGQLTREEFLNGVQSLFRPLAQREAQATRENPAQRGPFAPSGQRPEGRDRNLDFLLGLDRNGDGKLTPDEIPEGVRERFEMLLARLNLDALDLNQLSNVARDEMVRDVLNELFMRRNRPLVTETGEDPPRERPRGDQPPRGPFEERPRVDGPTRDAESRREGGPPGDPPPFREGQPPFGGPPPFAGEFRGPEFFRRIDRDGDRRLSRDEVRLLIEVFDDLDRNNDGFLDMAELMGFAGPGEGGPRPEGRSPFEVQPPRERDPREGTGSRPEGGRPFSPERVQEPNPEQMFNRLDGDGDGFLTESELPEPMRPGLRVMDRDGDGRVSKEEFIDFYRRMREGGRLGGEGERPFAPDRREGGTPESREGREPRPERESREPREEREAREERSRPDEEGRGRPETERPRRPQTDE